MGMVEGVGARPVFVGHGTEKAADESDGVIPFSGGEVRLVPAIVLDNEYPHEEKGVNGGESERNPIGPLKAEVHEYP